MQDIQNRNDIIQLVDSFYDQVLVDPMIGYFFNEVAAIDRSTHMPKMYDFWEGTLFGTGNYKGNPMAAHIQLHKKAPLEAAHFDHWLKLFKQTVDRLFQGKMAEEAKSRAENISRLMHFKTTSSQSKGFIQ